MFLREEFFLYTVHSSALSSGNESGPFMHFRACPKWPLLGSFQNPKSPFKYGDSGGGRIRGGRAEGGSEGGREGEALKTRNRCKTERGGGPSAQEQGGREEIGSPFRHLHLTPCLGSV